MMMSRCGLEEMLVRQRVPSTTFCAVAGASAQVPIVSQNKQVFGSSVKKTVAGFTLMEILISMIVLTILSVGLAGFFIYAQKGAIMGDDKTIALQVIEKTLQELRSSSTEVFLSWAQGSVIVNKTISELKNGTVTVTIGPETVVTDDFKEMIVAVSWTNAAGRSQSIKIVAGVYNECS